MASRVPSGSEDSPNNPGTQKKKRNVLSKEQKQVLQEHFKKNNYVSQKECELLAQSLGMRKEQIKLYFKNRRARERGKKCQQLPGNIESGPHCLPIYPKDTEVPISDSSMDSVFQRQEDASCSQFVPSRNSPQQESTFSLIDQPLEEASFSKTHTDRVLQSQKCRKRPRKPKHLSSDRSSLPNVSSSPDVSARAESICERHPGLSSPPLLRPSSPTKHPESSFSIYQAPSDLNPNPENFSLSSSLDQMAIFDNIDRACDIYLKIIQGRKQKKPQKKTMV